MHCTGATNCGPNNELRSCVSRSLRHDFMNTFLTRSNLWSSQHDRAVFERSNGSARMRAGCGRRKCVMIRHIPDLSVIASTLWHFGGRARWTRFTHLRCTIAASPSGRFGQISLGGIRRWAAHRPFVWRWHVAHNCRWREREQRSWCLRVRGWGRNEESAG